jgi:hypothetical protein
MRQGVPRAGEGDHAHLDPKRKLRVEYERKKKGQNKPVNQKQAKSEEKTDEGGSEGHKAKTLTANQRQQIRDANVLLQNKMMRLAVEPIPWTQKIEDRADLTAYQISLMKLNFDRKLSAMDFRAHNDAIRNLREVMVGVEAKSPFDANDVVIQFVQSIKNTQLKNALIGYLRDESRSQEDLQRA